MFSAWGRFIYRFRRPVAVMAVALAIGSIGLASQATGALSAGGWTDPDSESTAVTDRLEAEFGAGGGAIIAVFRGSAGSSGVPSISESEKRIAENPRDATAFRDLATAHQAEGNTAEAISASPGRSLAKWLRVTVRELIIPMIIPHRVSRRLLPSPTCGRSFSRRAAMARCGI